MASYRKKQKKQPFIFFCEEMQQMIPELKGKKLPQLIEHCGEIWSRMTPAEREPYVNTARDFAEHGYCPGTVMRKVLTKEADVIAKFDSTGRSLRSRQREAESRRYAKRLMEEDILKKAARRQHHSLISPINARFHIMTVHTWCTTDYGEAHPAEIGLVEMTIRKGISSRWCQLISPIQVPYGYSSDVQSRTEKVHQISSFTKNLSEDVGGIYRKILQILTAKPGERYAGEDIVLPEFESLPLPEEFLHARDQKLLPVYVMPEEAEEIYKVFKFISANFKIDVKFPLYDLSMFMMQLVNNSIGPEIKPMTSAIAEMELKKDVILYTLNISCAYHEKTESYNCAAAKATRRAIILCDFACQAYNILAKQGSHTLFPCGDNSKMNNTTIGSILEPIADIAETCNKVTRNDVREMTYHPFERALKRGRLNGDEKGIHALNFDLEGCPIVENPPRHESYLARLKKYEDASEPSFWDPPTIDMSTSDAIIRARLGNDSTLSSTFRTANDASWSNQGSG